MRKLIFILFVILVVSVSQAVIVKFEAENARVYYQAGTAWMTQENENAGGGECITGTENLPAQTETSVRRYSFNIPADTYNLYVRYSILTETTDPRGQAQWDNDSVFLSDSSFAVDATLGMYNGLAATGVDDISTLNNSFGWVQVDTGYEMAADGTGYLIIQPREDGLLVDAFAFVTDGEEVTDELLNTVIVGGEPHDPMVTPQWEDGSVGDMQPNNEDVEVTLHFKAAGDPNQLADPPLPVNPDVVGHYIYLSNGVAADDPNVYLRDYIEQGSVTDPNVSYGPFTLKEGTAYYWQVEEGLDDGTGNPYAAGDPNNTIWGPVWSFTTISVKPKILVDPENALMDAGGNASFTVTAGPSPVVTDYRWYKVGDPDIELSDGGIYSNTRTATLTITGAAAGDEGQFYCIAYNGDPDTTGIPSDPSSAAKLWYPRLTSHYPFESIIGGNSTPDIVGGYDMELLSDEGNTDLPVQGDGVPELAPDTSSLSFDNSVAADPNQYALAEVGVADYADITIAVWVYWNGGDPWQRIVDFGNNTNEYMFLTPAALDGGVRFAVSNNGEQSIDTGEPLPIGEWTYVTATLSGDTARLYVNGELELTGTITHDPDDYAPSQNNYIAKSQWPDPYFDGMIDDLKIYNYARTTEQIAQDYLDVRGDWVCNQELNDLAYDFDGDCQIGLGDLAMMLTAEWMDSYRIYPGE
jgi:hypothetical protein